MAFVHESNYVSGKEGTAFATIEGKIYELFYLKNLEAKIEKTKDEVPTLGRRGIGTKSKGWKGTGSMTIYYCTSTFRNLMLKYVKTGIDTYFDIQVVNDDPESVAFGKQTITLKDCNIDSLIMAKLDVEASTLEEEVPFTFSDVDGLDSFKI